MASFRDQFRLKLQRFVGGELGELHVQNDGRPMTAKELDTVFDVLADLGANMAFKRRMTAKYGVRPPATRAKKTPAAT